MSRPPGHIDGDRALVRPSQDDRRHRAGARTTGQGLPDAPFDHAHPHVTRLDGATNSTLAPSGNVAGSSSGGPDEVEQVDGSVHGQTRFGLPQVATVP